MLIDIHSHFYPSSYIEFLRKRNIPPNVVTREGSDRLVMYADQANSVKPKGAKLGPEYFDLQAKLATMDQHGIDGTVVSIGNPWLDFLSGQEASERAAEMNDDLAKQCEQTGGRLWPLACIPAGDLAASIAELKRIAKNKTAVGVLTSTRLGSGWVYEESAMPFWEAAEETGLPIFLHPFYGIADGSMSADNDMLRFALEFPFETTVVASRLIMAGLFDNFPGVKVILAHAGGALPMLAGRLEAYCGKGVRDKVKAPLNEYLKYFYFDAITYSPEVLQMAASLVGIEHLMFGTDHPYAAADPEKIRETVEKAGLLEVEQSQILSENACKLFHLH